MPATASTSLSSPDPAWAVGTIHAESAISLFPYGSLLFPIADGPFGGKSAENVPVESSDLSEWAIDQSGRFCANLTGGPYCTGNRLATEAASARHRSARCLPYQTCLRLNANHANTYSFGLTPTGHRTLWLHASSGLTSKSPRYLDVVWTDLAVALRALPPDFDNTPP